MSPPKLPADPGRQSLARPLTEAEQVLAHALETIFGTGEHDFAQVSAKLDAAGVKRPSGTDAAWTAALLEEELKRINASLDAAYANGGA